jgi:hypothetical protein
MGACSAACHDGSWACLGQVATPIPFPKLDVTFTDFVTGAVVANVSARVCKDDDVDCSSPGTVRISDAAGKVTVPYGELEHGCIRYESADTKTICAYPPPSIGQAALPVFRAVDYARFFTSAPPPAGRGVVLAFVHDCAGAPGSGVSFSSSSSARALYWRKGQFVADAFETDDSGLAALVDLDAPSVHVIRGEISPTIAPVGQVPIPVRKDVISLVSLGP